MGTQLPLSESGTAAPTFRPMSIVAKWSPISATAQLVCSVTSHFSHIHRVPRSDPVMAAAIFVDDLARKTYFLTYMPTYSMHVHEYACTTTIMHIHAV